MICPLTLPVTDRFSLIIRYLCASVIGRESVLTHAVTMAICERLIGFSARFAALVARVRSGKVYVPRTRRPRAAPQYVPPCEPAALPAHVPPKLPRGFAWLVKLIPDTVNYGSQLNHLLADPEMAALVSAAPGLVRMLRPMCRMLGVSPLPDLLAPPPTAPRAARRRAPKVTQPPLRPIYPKSRVLGGIETYGRRSRGGFSSA